MCYWSDFEFISLSFVELLRWLAFLVVGHLPVSGYCFPMQYKTEEMWSRLLQILIMPLILCLYRRRRQRPELCHFLLSAADVGPSLSQPHWISGSGAEGVGDGWPSLLGQMQPFKEEWQRGGIYLKLNNWVPEWTHSPNLFLLSALSLFVLHWSSPHCSCCSWTACGKWWISTQQLLSSQRPIWLYSATACGSHSSVLSSLILPNSELST